MKINATFVKRRFQDSGKDQAPDYYVYEFTDIQDEEGNVYGDKWIKETKLMKAVRFKKGEKYQINLSERPYSKDAINLPYPIEILWNNGYRAIKHGGRIITYDPKSRKYFDRSNRQEVDRNFKPKKGEKLFDGVERYNTAALNKFMRGEMTEDLLLKMNSRGVYFFIRYYDPQDRRKSGGNSYGYTQDETKGNYILIQKESQEEIDRDIESIKQSYIKPSIQKHFKIITEILPPKKRRK